MFAYVFVVVITAAAVVVRWFLDPWLGDRLALVTLFAAVAAAVWVGGYRPAILAAVLGYFACDYLFIGPPGSFGFYDVPNLIGLLAYLVSCSIIIGFGQTMRRARQRARERRELLRVTLASIGDAVMTTDTGGRITYLNAAAEKLTGWTGDEAAGQPIDTVFNVIDEQTRQRVESPVIRVLREGAVIGLANHTLLITRAGKEQPIDDSAAPILDEHGRISGCVLVFHDVTERRRAEQALRRSERELADFFENASVSLHWVGPDGIILRVNQAELDLLGYRREQYLGHHIAEFHADQPVIEDILARLGRGEMIREYPARLRCRDGSLREVLINSNVLFEDGKFIHTRCLTIDITERRQAEQARRESEQRFRLMADAAPVLIWISGTDRLCTWFNKPWLEFTGRTMEQELGNGWTGNIHPDDCDTCLKVHAAAFDARRSFTMEYRLGRHDGQYRWILDNGIPRYAANGSFAGYIGSCIDITELKQAQEALRETDRRKDEFLATLAHELRNPLAPIRNAVQILLSKNYPDPDLQWSWQVIDRQVQYMARLLDDLLDMSRISHNKLDLRKQRIELAAVIQMALETSRPLIDGGGHELTVTLPPAPVYLDADPVRLVQIFSNLLNNATRYTETGGHIRLTGRQHGREVVVSVTDDGIGIAAEMLPRVFDMFSQSKNALERSQYGLGIGLSLVRGLVELHGGSIEARSDGTGRGSEFIMRLPVAVAAPAAEPVRAAEEPASAPLTKQCILIVDDNRDSADSSAMLLKILGHEIHTAYDGEEAIAAAAKLKPDVILLDIGMPKLNGYDVCRHIRAQPWGGEIVLIALTGWGQEDDRRRTGEAGFDHHMVKPVDPGALIKLLASLAVAEQAG